VLVIQGEPEWAAFGDFAGLEAERRGLAAVVVDGWIRDLAELRTMRFSLYARGTTPVGGGLTANGEVGITLRIAETDVAAGDWIFADDDGVTVCPEAELEGAVARGHEVIRNENETRAALQSGAGFVDAPFGGGATLRERLGLDGVADKPA
jgi:regulator of RNase E activity RraA